MLFSFALIFLVGILLGQVVGWIKLPPLLGMLLAGIILGPFGWGLLDETTLTISSQLRQIALVIILLRAGLSLEWKKLQSVGPTAMLLCFVPACFEMTATIIFAPMLLGFSFQEAALLGAVLAAVSPAVIVPKMLQLMEKGYGIIKGIPQMILSGASVDDVFVIVVFTSFLGMAQGQGVSAVSFLQIPISIILGIAGGCAVGWAISFLLKKWKPISAIQTICLLSVAFLLVSVEDFLKGTVPFSGLLGVMAMGLVAQSQLKTTISQTNGQLSKMWVAAEPMLFVLVGASVNISYLFRAGIPAVILLCLAILVRMVGVWVSTLPSSLEPKERLFCMIAYTPKATVQAAIGGIPLAAGLACGNSILAVAVLSIFLTAPTGAFLIEKTYTRLLQKS